MKKVLGSFVIVQLVLVLCVTGGWAQDCADESKLMGTWDRYEIFGIFEGEDEKTIVEIMRSLEAGEKTIEDLSGELEEFSLSGVVKILGEPEKTLFYTEIEREKALVVAATLEGTWKLDCNDLTVVLHSYFGEPEVTVDENAVSSEEEKALMKKMAEQVKAEISEKWKDREGKITSFKEEDGEILLVFVGEHFMLTKAKESEVEEEEGEEEEGWFHLLKKRL